MPHSRSPVKNALMIPMIAGLCAASLSWAGAVTGYVLPAYKLTPTQQGQFARDGQMSQFWSSWDRSGSLDYLNMTPSQNGWVDAMNTFSGPSDAELNIRAAYDENALYLMFEMTDNYWDSPAGIGSDNVGIFLDKISSQEIRDANPYQVYIQPDWNWTLTYYSVEYQVAVGSSATALPSGMNINYPSGTYVEYNSVSLFSLGTEYSGWDLDLTSVSPNVRRMEWKIPWTWVGCGGGIGAMPAINKMIAMSGGYNDSDSPTQTGRKGLRWKEKDPFNDCLDKNPPHAYCDSWGDILISNQMLDTIGFLISSPATSALWLTGTQKNIQWTTRGTIPNVKIEYTTNGSAWSTIIASVANTGTYPWTVPAAITSTACKIRISDATDNSPYAESGTFAISIPQMITVTSPNGGENWTIGSSHVITWTTTGIVPIVKIELSSDNGSNWTNIATAISNTNTFSWTVPNINSSNCRIRVRDTATGGASDISNAPFSIEPAPTVTVVSPNGGENWITESIHPIIWNTTGTLGAVKLEYSINGSTWIVIAASTPNAGTYDWTLPKTPSTICKIRVSDPTSGTITDMSNTTFTISTSSTITITSPNGGERWNVGTQHPITWTSQGSIENIKIEYSTDVGVRWLTIVAGIPDNGSYVWSVPMNPSHNCIIRIRDAVYGVPFDLSDSLFTITPIVHVLDCNIPKFTTMGSICHERNSGAVTINIGLACAGNIYAVIFGPDGRMIRQFNNGSASAGYHSFQWDGHNLQGQIIRNGCYQVKIRAGNATFIKPLVMAR